MTGSQLSEAYDKVAKGATRLSVMREYGLSYDQVCELFERCGRNKSQPMLPPEACQAAIKQMMEASA